MSKLSIDTYDFSSDTPFNKKLNRYNHELGPPSDYDHRMIAVLKMIPPEGIVNMFDSVDIPGLGRVVYGGKGEVIRVRWFKE